MVKSGIIIEIINFILMRSAQMICFDTRIVWTTALS